MGPPKDPTDGGRAMWDTKIQAHRYAVVAMAGVKCDKKIQVPHYMFNVSSRFSIDVYSQPIYTCMPNFIKIGQI